MTESIAQRLGVPEWEFRVVFGKSRIDYDPGKEGANRRKHNYSLESAAYLLEACVSFLSSRRMMTSDGFQEKGEIRHQHTVEDDDGKLVTVVTTMRPDEIIRVISARRASLDEREEFGRRFGASLPRGS